MKTKQDLSFCGTYKEVFEGYFIYKNSLGFNFEYREKLQLVKLNRFLNDYNYSKIILTKEMVDRYLDNIKELSSATQHTYECRIRQVALYMRNLGYSDIYVLPENRIKVTTDFVPYIFSPHEMEKIFHLRRLRRWFRLSRKDFLT